MKKNQYAFVRIGLGTGMIFGEFFGPFSKLLEREIFVEIVRCCMMQYPNYPLTSIKFLDHLPENREAILPLQYEALIDFGSSLK